MNTNGTGDDRDNINIPPLNHVPTTAVVYNHPHGEGRTCKIFNIIEMSDGYMYGNIQVGKRIVCIYREPKNKVWYLS